MAAEMAGVARAGWVLAGFEHMVRPQGKAAQILGGAHAMTDVTGFGLAGHLLGLCEASGVGATLDLASVPTMRGAIELATRGVQSTLFADNRALAPELQCTGKAALLFDPQTAGGLLAAVAPEQADGLVNQLQECGYEAARIGTVTNAAARITLA